MSSGQVAAFSAAGSARACIFISSQTSEAVFRSWDCRRRGDFDKERKRHIGSLKEYGSMDASARDLAQNFDIEKLTPEFYADPYPTYRALREHAPVKLLPNGSYFLTRYDDLVG